MRGSLGSRRRRRREKDVNKWIFNPAVQQKRQQRILHELIWKEKKKLNYAAMTCNVGVKVALRERDNDDAGWERAAERRETMGPSPVSVCVILSLLHAQKNSLFFLLLLLLLLWVMRCQRHHPNTKQNLFKKSLLYTYQTRKRGERYIAYM